MKKKTLLFIAVLVAIIFVVYVYIQHKSNTINEEGLQNVSVRLPIPVVDGAFAPLYIAQDKGFWAQEGLSVSLEPGSPELNPTAMVRQGTDHIGIAGGPELRMTAKDKGSELIAFFLLHKESNFSTILVPIDSPIESVQDLQDKSIGFFYGHISTDVIRAFLKQENITVNEVDVGFDYSQLIIGQIDAQWAFRPTAGVNLPAKGFKVKEISPADYSITTHGYTFITSQMIRDNDPELIQKFTNGLIRAVKYSLEHTEEAIQITVNRSNNTLSYDIVKQQIEIYHKAIQNNRSIGVITEDLLLDTKNRLVNQGLLSHDFNIKSGIDNSFVEQFYSTSGY